MENRIKELREELHMTQVRLSIELEVSQETISAYESGKHYPSVASLLKLAEIFNTSCDYILGISNIRFPMQNVLPSVRDQLISQKWKLLTEYQQDITLAYIDGLLSMNNECKKTI